MYCHKCGSPLQPAASFCHKCGVAVAAPTNRTQDGTLGNTRQVPLPDAVHRQRSREIWNPNACANWSLLFTPAFGAYLQYLNWQRMGKSEQATASLYWFYASCALLAIYPFVGMASAGGADQAGNASNGIALLYLIVWYFANGRKQGQYVKSKVGTQYARRGWAKPLLIAVGASVGYFVAVFAIAYALVS